MNMNPLVSVCIPTYRGAQHIGQAIESVLAQTFSDLELIVVDDKSPDETVTVIEKFNDSRIRLFRNSINLGPEGNWNRCLTEARGKYFKLLPHDDLLHPDCLRRQVEVLETDQTQSLALVFSAREVIGPDGRVILQRRYPAPRSRVIDASEVIRSCARKGTNLIGEPGGVMFRRSIADTVGKFDATNPYVIDLDYWLRLLAYGDAYYIDEPLATFRVSPLQWSVALGQSQNRDFNGLMSRVGPQLKPALSSYDLALSRATSWINKWARMAFYRIYLR